MILIIIIKRLDINKDGRIDLCEFKVKKKKKKKVLMKKKLKKKLKNLKINYNKN